MMRTVTQRKSIISNRTGFRLLLVVFFISCISGSLKAQQVEYGSGTFRGQWFVGLGIGPRMFFADHARQLDMIDRLTFGADMYVGKWLSPYVGMRLGGSFQTLKGATLESNPIFSHAVPGTGFVIPDGDGGNTRLFKQQFDAWHLYADLLFDVSTAFEGVDEFRFWTLAPFIGLGYISTWDRPEAHEITFNLGLLNSLHLGPAVDLNFDIRGNLMKDRFHTISPIDMGGRPFDGILSVNLGVTFRFGGSTQPKSVYYPEPIYTPAQPRDPYVVERVTEWKDVATDVLVLFQIGQSELLRDARVQLGFLARLMLQYPEGTYTITGYADEGTGNPELNLRLSRARAERVRDCLINEFGIAPSRLKTAAAGGVENRYYNDPSLSRSVIIRPDKY